MTGFASVVFEAETLECSWELRTFNHRFLDVSMRLPDDLKWLEPACREHIGRHGKRGRVDGTLRVVAGGTAAAAAKLDRAALDGLRGLEQTVLEVFDRAQPLSVGEILRFDGILTAPTPVAERLEPGLLANLDAALTSLGNSRAAEGARIGGFLADRVAALAAGVAAARPLAGATLARYRDRLNERLRQLDTAAQPERLEQELAIVAQRMDITEELDRLTSHVVEIRSILTRDEPIGRRLDFLIQELNREVNTLSSKSPDEELTRIAVDLKVVIEQMREQVQNLE